MKKLVRSIDRIFNPETSFSEPTTGLEFLHDSNRKSKGWRDFFQRFRTGNAAEKDLYIDLPPFRHLAQRYRPGSVLDIGCGAGVYLKYFASQGAQLIRGVDSVENKAPYLQPDEYVPVDFGKPLDLAQTFDLVICVGLLQHIPAHSERTLISGIAEHARERIVFSGGQTGQPGDGDFNWRPISQWLDLFASFGWYPCLFDTLALRSLSTFPWFRSGLVVLTRDSHGAAVARERLTELEQQQSRQSKHRPAVITHSFTEMANKLLANPDSRSVAVANAVQNTLARVFTVRADTGEVVILGRTTTDWGKLGGRKARG